MKKLTIDEQIAQHNKDICLLQAKENLSVEQVDQVEDLLFRVNELAHASAKNKYEAFLKSLNMNEFDQFLGLITLPSGFEPFHKKIYKEKEAEHQIFCDKIMGKTNV